MAINSFSIDSHLYKNSVALIFIRRVYFYTYISVLEFFFFIRNSTGGLFKLIKSD